MIQRENSKLGKILNWSILALLTCPGKSKACKAACYVTKGFYNYASTQEALRKNTELRKTRNWVTNMVLRINRSANKIFRIHVSGDFDSVTYIKRWITIVRACPDTTFYFYTRSWRHKKYLTSLRALAREPNVIGWFSADFTMPKPPRYQSIKIAYMSTHDEDVPKYKVDLIFRTQHKKPLKRMGPHNTLVCPNEQGLPDSKNITCEKCRLCFTPEKLELVSLKPKEKACA